MVFGRDSGLPASRSRIFQFLFSERRFASTQPAGPDPTIMKSYSLRKIMGSENTTRINIVVGQVTGHFTQIKRMHLFVPRSIPILPKWKAFSLRLAKKLKLSYCSRRTSRGFNISGMIFRSWPRVRVTAIGSKTTIRTNHIPLWVDGLC